MNNTTKKYFFIVLKILIAISAYSYIYLKLKDFNFDIEFDSSRLYLLIFAFLLMFDNWGVESLKWKLLLSKYENISFVKSFMAVITGVTSSVFTPNRVGEFVGRIFFITDENKGKAILSTLVGSYSQVIVTISLGSVALFFSEPIYNFGFSLDWINLGFALLSIVLIVLFLKISIISNLLIRFSRFKKINDVLDSLNLYSTGDLLKVLMLSLLRYSVFAIQFVLIVYFFNIEISFVNILLGLAQFYLVLMIIPTISLAEVGVRAMIAAEVFSQYITDANESYFALITLSISILWLINIVVPAILGSVLMFFSSRNSEE